MRETIYHPHPDPLIGKLHHWTAVQSLTEVERIALESLRQRRLVLSYRDDGVEFVKYSGAATMQTR